MLMHHLKRALGAAVAFSTLAFAAPGFAAEPAGAFSAATPTLGTTPGTMDLFYRVPTIGISMLVRGMGYSDDDGNWISLAGQQILSARVVIDFTPEPGVDVSMLRMDMAVPVEGSQSQFFLVTGSQLVETTPGTWHYELSTDLFNGTILDGRFGIESYGLTPDGASIGLPGMLSPETGFYFTVSTPVPEAGSALMLLAGLGAGVPVLARRRRTVALAAA